MTFSSGTPQQPDTPSQLTGPELAALIDHTLLTPEATDADVAAALAEAKELGAHSLCVTPARLPLDNPELPVTAVVGFPSGAHNSLAKAFSARIAVDQGATELDMVVDLGAVTAGAWNMVMADIVTVREAAPSPVVLKVILETAYLLTLPDGAERIDRCCQIALAAGADFVKTSTGYHPAGGASVEAVRIMQESIGGKMGIKAAGGIRTRSQALELVAAGATRLGCSRTREIVTAD
ncbi:MAG TPA: deoxyribose-phosphate aldolase [Corynebacteriales bacterium]|nr:deoxyribose-phosphate aldolase [Mycobacteriales bacterium]